MTSPSASRVRHQPEQIDLPLPGIAGDPMPAPYVSFHAVGARGILFDAAGQKLYLVNRTAGFIWCCLAEGMTVAEIAAELVGRSTSDPLSAAALVAQAIRNWTALGLVGPNETEWQDATQNLQATKAEEVVSGASMDGSHVRFARVLDRGFAIRFSDEELAALALPLLEAHLAETPPSLAATVDVLRNDDGSIAIRHNGATMQTLDGVGPLAPAVFASLVRVALEYSAGYPALHAALVRGASGAVLFPGVSGCGKSTLTAGLLAAGYEVLGDDTVVFDRDTLRVRPVTPYLCIKSGAWELIGDRLPELWSRPNYVRADGLHVRYLLARSWDRAPESGEAVRTIVFARYRENVPTKLTRVAGFLALRELLPSLDPIGHRFTADDVDRLIGWMDGVDCYVLNHGSLPEALEALEGVVR